MSTILDKPKFWYFFVFIVILSLFIYGLKLDNDISLLQLLKLNNSQLSNELNVIKESNTKLNKEISLLKPLKTENSQLVNQVKVLMDDNTNLKKDTTDLKEELTIQSYKNDKLQTEIKNLEKKLNPYHRYGKNKGRLTIFTTCSNGGKTKVFLDGKNVGYFEKYYPDGPPSCGYSKVGSVISETVIAGSHHIKAEDKNNRTWDFYVIVKEDQCFSQKLTCK